MVDKGKPGKGKAPERSPSQPKVSRRDMLLAGGAAAAFGALPQSAAAESKGTAAPGKQAKPSGKPHPVRRTKPLGRPYNVVLFISDEEAYHLRPAEGYTTPGREELVRRGTTFHNHYIGAAMCTPSRGVMFSGQPPLVGVPRRDPDERRCDVVHVLQLLSEPHPRQRSEHEGRHRCADGARFLGQHCGWCSGPPIMANSVAPMGGYAERARCLTSRNVTSRRSSCTPNIRAGGTAKR